MHIVSPGGRVSRARAYKWSSVESAVDDAETGTVSLFTADEEADSFQLGFYVRHNPKVARGSQVPPYLWMVDGATSHDDRAVTATARVLEIAATHMGVLHGNVTRFGNSAQARSELIGGRTGMDDQPPLFQQRYEHDWWRNQGEVWTRCRRLYWKTLLGPTLATAAGGAAAARAAGALELEEINGALLFRAMQGPPRDSLDPEFLAATTSLRRWLWPHTFQNPLDAAGFEAEVGLAVPAVPTEDPVA